MTSLRPGQITVGDVADFLVAQGFNGRASYDGKIPDMPDNTVIVTRNGGPGESLDGYVDTVSFQLRTIGPQRDAIAAETTAWDLDFMLCPPPPESLRAGLIGTQQVVKVTRQGSPPTRDRTDTASRTHLVCSYLLSVSRVAT